MFKNTPGCLRKNIGKGEKQKRRFKLQKQDHGFYRGVAVFQIAAMALFGGFPPASVPDEDVYEEHLEKFTESASGSHIGKDED